ncbi:MAG TPA: GerMN domain-containing protein [Pseudonocardiaceae bacterium]
MSTGTAPTQAPNSALPIYYVADTAAGPRLYREFHAVPTTDPGSDAVRELLAKPTGLDPDYRSHWPAGTTLRSAVQHAGGVITVDLSGEARSAQVGAELAELTVQQLVYTVQGALQSPDPVRILIDGATVPELWGHVSTAQPVQRADQYRTRSLVQIDNPANGARVGRTFTVSGEATSFEANVPWQVLRDGVVVQSGYTMAGSTEFDSFTFSLTLDPGDYTVRITEDNACGDACRAPFEDTKLVHVAG